jgi:hypothetical protein
MSKNLSNHIAIAHAMKFSILNPAENLRRSALILELTTRERPFRKNELKKFMAQDFSRSGIDAGAPSVYFDTGKIEYKNAFEKIGYGATIVAGAAAILNPVGIVAIGSSALAIAAGGYVLTMNDDDKIIKAVSDHILSVSSMMWENPDSKKVMTAEVLEILKDEYHLDFKATLEDHKKEMSPAWQEQMEIYENLLEKTKDELEVDMSKKIAGAMNETVSKVLDAINDDQLDMEKRRVAAQRATGELQGKVFLGKFLAKEILGDKAGEVVGGIADAAVQVNSIFDSLLAVNPALGPFGAAAGLLSVGMNLSDLFGKKGLTENQIIMNAIGNVQESIRSLHEDMEKWFGVVIDNQKEMMITIEKRFDKLKDKLETNHAEVMKGLKELMSEVQVARSDSRDIALENKEGEFLDYVEKLKAEFRALPKNPDYNTVRDSIICFYRNATQTSKGLIYTDLPRTGKYDWNPDKIAIKLENISSPDLCVGLLPAIMIRLTNEGYKKGEINNPILLGQSAVALVAAYEMFPKYIRMFEDLKKKESYIGKIRTEIENTKESLLEVTSQNSALEIFKAYKEMLIQKLDECIEQACVEILPSGREIIIQGVGPLNAITHKEVPELTKNNVAYARDIPANSVLLNDNIYTGPGNDDFAHLVLGGTGVANFGNCRTFEWTGLDQQNPERAYTDSDNLLKTGERFGVISTERTERLEDKDNYFVPGRVPEECGVPSSPHGYFHVPECYLVKTFTVINITFLSEEKGQPVVNGSGERQGWITADLEESSIAYGYSNNKIDMNKTAGRVSLPEPFPLGKTQNISYLSHGLSYNFNDKLVSNSAELLDYLEGKLNELHKFRGDILDKTQRLLKGEGVKVSSILDKDIKATYLSLRYLAGLSVYVKTGDLEVGTAVARSSFKFNKEDSSILLPTIEDIATLVAKVTGSKYLQDAEKGNSTDDLKTYLHKEVGGLIEKAMNDFIAAYFPKEMDGKMRLQELNVPIMMLNAAELNIKKLGRAR